MKRHHKNPKHTIDQTNVRASLTMTPNLVLKLHQIWYFGVIIFFVISNHDTKYYTKNNIIYFDIFSFNSFSNLLFVIDKKLFYQNLLCLLNFFTFMFKFIYIFGFNNIILFIYLFYIKYYIKITNF